MPFDAAPRPVGLVESHQPSTVAPFVIFALPRSGTAWTARLLTYGDWTCGHDEIRHMRSLDDVKAWIGQPCTGTAETGAAPFWRTLMALQPNARVVTIRRPVADVVESLLRLDMRGVCTWDRAVLTRAISRLDAKLDQIEARVPGVLSVPFADLFSESTSAKVFEHCLPYQHDHAWWAAGSPVNVQCNMPAMMRYMIANRDALRRLAAAVKQKTLASMPRRVIDAEGITIQEEDCETWYRDGKKCFEEHSVQLGQEPNDYERRNWPVMMMASKLGFMQIITGRCNGRMFGYCAAYICPANDDASVMSSLHISIFCSKDFSGMGQRLQRASIEALRKRGVNETFFRAGIYGDGPRMEKVYERMGAEKFGQMYRLPLSGG